MPPPHGKPRVKEETPERVMAHASVAPTGAPLVTPLGPADKDTETTFTAKELEFMEASDEGLSTCAPLGDLDRGSLMGSLDDRASCTSGASGSSAKPTGHGLRKEEESQAHCLSLCFT